MPDPTEFVITATFTSALGIFATIASARKLLGKKHGAHTPPAFEFEDSQFADPLPQPQAMPPELPVGRVSTWFYHPYDLLGIGLIYSIFFALVIASVRAPHAGEGELSMNALEQSIAFQFISAGIVTSFMVSRVRPVTWLGLNWPGWRWIFLIAPGAVVSMWIFFAGLQEVGFMKWIESFGVETVQDTVKILQTTPNRVILSMMIFAAVIVAPICEEIVFRGYFYSASKKFLGPWAAGICSALVFAAAHGSLAALLPLFIFGCVLVFVYEKTGSLWAPMALHFCFNGATVCVQMIARYYHIPLDGVS